MITSLLASSLLYRGISNYATKQSTVTGGLKYCLLFSYWVVLPCIALSFIGLSYIGLCCAVLSFNVVFLCGVVWCGVVWCGVVWCIVLCRISLFFTHFLLCIVSYVMSLIYINSTERTNCIVRTIGIGVI